MNARSEQLRRELARPLAHPDPADMQSHGQETLAWVVRHLQSLEDQPIGRTAGRAEMEALLREPPPEEGQGFAGALRAFQERVAPFAFRINHPRFFAFIPSAPSFLSFLGDLLCAGTNFFA